MNYEKYMARCIELARQAEGRTSPNPMVGALVVSDDGRIIAEGFHKKAGDAHAEVEALDLAGEAARGATLFVSLEPCCHHGKTPPCSDRVASSGVKRVVCSMVDPNPKVSGGGLKQLQDAGIEVHAGIMEEEARYLNRAFLKWIACRLPWVSLKMAATLDGRIADRHGKSRWISGPSARRFVHDLRNRSDCVLVGGSTAIADDAELIVRDIEDSRNPVRAILDTQIRLPADSKLALNADGKTWVFGSQQAIARTAAELPNVKLIPCGLNGASLDLEAVLSYLGEHNILSVLCEGGGRLASAILPLVDEIYWIVAPKLMNDSEARPVLAGCGNSNIEELRSWKLHSTMQLDADVLLHYLR